LLDEVREELEAHVELLAARYIRSGMDPDEARLTARRQLGNTTRVREEIYTMNTPMDSLIHDFSSAVRHLRRNLRFVVVAVLILGLGIGSATAVFSVSETLLLRPLPYPDANRLVTLRSMSPDPAFPYERAAGGTLADWQMEGTLFEAIAGYRWNTIDLVGGGQSERLRGLFVTPEFFDVFGVPLVGRGFQAEDRGTRALVLGYDVWRRRFEAATSIVGGTLDLNVRNLKRVGPTRHTVVGVATEPVRFPPVTADFQLGLASVVDTIDFWKPEFVSPTSAREPHAREFDVVGKLRPGVTVEQAQREIDAIAQRQAERYPETHRGWRVQVVPLRQHVASDARRGVLLLSLGTGMLLLIASANVATLLLARGAARHREVAIRAALGAARWRIVRQFLMEALILATMAGVVGIILTIGAIALARPWLPASLPVLQEIDLNPTVLFFGLICAVFTACLTGIAPALRSTRMNGGCLTGSEGRGVTLSGAQTAVIRVLVSAEVALTLVLLLSAGLLLRSALVASQVAPGFNPSNLLTMTVSLPENKFDWNHNAVFARDVIDAVRSLPAVRDAAVIQGVPMHEGSFYGSGTIEGYMPASSAEEPIWRIRVVSPSYWDVMQIPIIAGRKLEARDEEGERGRPRGIVASRSFANRYWPGQNALGKRVGVDLARMGLSVAPQTWWMTVVGVAEDIRYSGLEADPTVDVYYPQSLFPQAAITLIARTRVDPLHEVSTVRERIRTVDQDAFVTDVRSMDELIARSQAERRAGTLLVGTFSALALVLAVFGVYTVITQAVVQRQFEMGIRLALGAEPRRLIALAMRTALQPAMIGVAIGGLGATAVTRLMRSSLFGISSSDSMSWVGACATILIACIVAGYVPARQAARVDPMSVLRTE
jgi:putative ABC transport system permease protein